MTSQDKEATARLASAAAVPGRPNVLLVITDDQGYGDLGCSGNPWLRTPALDEFYADAVRLRDFHVGPTCAPLPDGQLAAPDIETLAEVARRWPAAPTQ